MRRRLNWAGILVGVALMWEGVATAQLAIGRWRDCPDFTAVYHVEVGDGEVYAAGRTGLFRYDLGDHTVDILGKSAGFSDAGVSALGRDPQSGVLVVAYSNSNIDLYAGGAVYNLSDIKRSALTGDKSIYAIRTRGGNAYLATGFGIVVVDLGRHEIKETYYLGAGGVRTPVYDLVFSADSIYAATGEGMKRLSVADPHPAVSDRWQTDGRAAGLTIAQLAVHGGDLLATAYTFDPAARAVLRFRGGRTDTLQQGDISSMRSACGRLTVSCRRGVWVYDDTLGLADTLTRYGDWGDMGAHDAVADGRGNIWVGHVWLGLVRRGADGDAFLIPDGPATGDNVYRLVAADGQMLLCPGGHTTTYANSYIEPSLATSRGRGWTTMRLAQQLSGEAYDLTDAAVNPKDTGETVVALWGTGIVSVRGGQVQAVYDESTTGGVLRPYSEGAYRSLRTGALAFDGDGTLWALNSLTSSALVSRRRDGTWEAHSTEALSPALEVDKLVWDSVRGYLWFAGRDNAVYVHDGGSRMARVNPNNGSKLQTQSVNVLAQDRSGNLWIGTDQGLKVIYDGHQAFRQGGNGETAPVSCSNITITNGDFYEYLMAYENITAIAVDGANRKWVGTNSGGLYLLSADGLEQLLHFTASDSPLLSDKITAIGIDPRSGEVYIGTDRGLQVYRSTATAAGAAPAEQVYAYPNPVRPGYEGVIAIKGFVRDAHIHITDAAGHTVYATQALGGQAIWNGRTADGTRVASGVYYVFSADVEGGAKAVTKVLIIR